MVHTQGPVKRQIRRKFGSEIYYSEDTHQSDAREKYVRTVHIHHKGLNEIHPICITFQRPIRSRRAVHIHLPREGGKESRFEFSSIFLLHLLFLRKERGGKKINIKIKRFSDSMLLFTHPHRVVQTPKAIATCGSSSQPQKLNVLEALNSRRRMSGVQTSVCTSTPYTNSYYFVYTQKRHAQMSLHFELCWRDFR